MLGAEATDGQAGPKLGTLQDRSAIDHASRDSHPELTTMPDEPAQEPSVPKGEPPGRDWAAYYRSTIGREPRPLFAKGMTVVEAAGIAPGQAIEIGFGDGRETLALLEAGWRVVAIDPAPAAAEVLQSQVPSHVAGRLEIRSVPAEDADLPPFHLLYAGYSLPFLGADAFDRFWNAARERLRRGGILVVNFFGPRDSWAGREGMRFIDVDAVRALVDGLELLALDEEDQDGNSFLGPKHWHVFDVIARRPPRPTG
jgi:SAM-dependent methyltransferase